MSGFFIVFGIEGVKHILMKVVPLHIDFNVRILGDVGQKFGYKLVTQDIGNAAIQVGN